MSGAVDVATRPSHEELEAFVVELRRAIADGEAGPGERLPPARDLAAVPGVNANTVLRPLRLLRTLRDEGLLELRQGRSDIGRHVAELPLDLLAHGLWPVRYSEGHRLADPTAGQARG